MAKKYKQLSEKDLTKIIGGWGYSLVFKDSYSWERAILKWLKR